MNFATVKGLTIPEGNVTKITDASGRVLWSAVKPMISFSIKESSGAYGTKTYQAEGGMTWGEWVDSEYNKDDYYTWYVVKDNMIFHTDESLYVYVPSNYTFPSPTDLIIADFAYELSKD